MKYSIRYDLRMWSIAFELWACVAISAAAPIFCFAEPTTTCHHGFADFSRGSFPDGGASIYVSKAGTIQLIPRWDLNNDGFIDLLVNQDENVMEAVDAFIYWGTKQGYKSLLPAFWKEMMPAYKLVQAIEEREKHVAFLPTFGGGPVKLVDLNKDGFLDIIFPNLIHNYSVHMEAYIYWGGPDGHSPKRMTKLPTLFAHELDIADFNRDGRLDIVVANYGNESGDRWGYANHRDSYIYWGRPEGYSPEHRTNIPTLSAVSCAAGDFNGDGWPDIAFANNNLKKKSLSIYCGSEAGFSTERRLQAANREANRLRAGDVNGDKVDDLLISAHGKGVDLFVGGANFSLDKPAAHFSIDANDAVTGDFNADGFADIAFAAAKGVGDSSQPGLSMSEVHWGGAAGFDLARSTALPTLSPKAVAAADLNADGFAELIFANFSDGHTHDVPSYVYWGDAKGYDPSRRANLQGFGAVGVAAADLDGSDVKDIVLMNQHSGLVAGGVPSVVFWGNAAHHFSESNCTLLAAKGPYASKIADFNDDGFADVVFTGNEASVHWGSPEGFKKVDWLNFKERLFGVTVGDYNRDGYLDLAFSNFDADPKNPNKVILVWGSDDGFDAKQSTEIPLHADRSCCGIGNADLNNDGYLDLVLPSGETLDGKSQILWGGENGFDAGRSTLLSTDGVGTPAVADLDDNGWLDLVFPGFHDLKTQNPHCKSLIYWNSADGFDDKRRSELEAYTTGEIVVADVNGDGHLDLIASNYKSNETRSLPIFIFWGNAQHEYSDTRRTELPAESSLGIQVLQLNDDKYPDIIVHNHIKDGDHTHGSYIYWGGEDAYSTERRTHLPTLGPHYSIGINPGNIFDRSDSSAFISPVVSMPADKRRLRLEWQGATPHKTSIGFYVRSSKTEEGLSKASWRAVAAGEMLQLEEDSTVMQYKAALATTDGGASPLLREVNLSFDE